MFAFIAKPVIHNNAAGQLYLFLNCKAYLLHISNNITQSIIYYEDILKKEKYMRHV